MLLDLKSAARGRCLPGALVRPISSFQKISRRRDPHSTPPHASPPQAAAGAPLRSHPPSSSAPSSDFLWADSDAPHAERRRAILAAHPEVKTLFGPCPKTKYQVVAVVSLQLAAAHFSTKLPVWQMLLLAWSLGGLLSSNLFLACHEIAHNLAFAKPLHNKLLSLFANLPVGIPFAISFQKYHMEHHCSQGEEGVDVDVPHELEASLVTRGGAAAKVVWVASQLFFYAIRPLLVRPKVPKFWDFANLATCVVFDLILLLTPGFGPRAFAYLLSSIVFGGGLHPAAGHFISEHYVFVEGQETYR